MATSEDEHSEGQGGAATSLPSGAVAALEAARRWLGAEADGLEAELHEQRAKAQRSRERQAEAAAISKSRVRRGEQAEESPAPPRPSRRRAADRRGNGKVKQAIRQRRKLGQAFKRRAARDNVRQQSQAEAMAAKVFEQHGIRHHFRELPKVAWFAGYYAGLDRNGVLAQQMLEQCNMPKRLQLLVLQAMRTPQPYKPRRDVCTGKREGQKRFEPRDGQAFKGRDWEEGQRGDAASQAIYVLCCAVFLWLAKSRSRRPGYSYKVRGFGRGVFASMCRCSKESLFGHARGLPGAMLALKQVGFIEYGQPPAELVSEYDRGPSGHAYLVFWFKASAEEQALAEMHEQLAELKRLPALQRVDLERAQGALRDAKGPAPPEVVDIDAADIPF